MKQTLLGAVAALAIAGSAQAGFLLNNGSQPTGSGRTVSGNNIAGGFTVFQPFNVPDAPGWAITTIGTDGWLIQDPLGLQMRGTLLPDDGAGNPDEGNPIAFATYLLHGDAFSSGWQDEVFNVIIPQGDYWMKWEDNGDANHWSAIFLGTSGLNSFSRRDDGAIFGAGPTALRIDGTIAPAPGALALLGLAGLAARRRRRS